jgi:hypothetical protein
VQCVRARNGAGCDHLRSYNLAKIERRVLDNLAGELRDPRAIELYLRSYHDRRRKNAAADNAQRDRLERDLAQARREKGRIIDLMVKERISDHEADEVLPGLRQRIADLEARLAAIAEAPVVSLHPAHSTAISARSISCRKC